MFFEVMNCSSDDKLLIFRFLCAHKRRLPLIFTAKSCVYSANNNLERNNSRQVDKSSPKHTLKVNPSLPVWKARCIALTHLLAFLSSAETAFNISPHEDRFEAPGIEGVHPNYFSFRFSFHSLATPWKFRRRIFQHI